jgi:hypothetical protein
MPSARCQLLVEASLVQESDVHFDADPPANGPFQELLDASTWYGCTTSLAAMLTRFQSRAVPVDGTRCLPTSPHLPFTLLPFDWLLCDTVRNAQGSLAQRLVILRWLLLPYLARKHMRAPFQGLAGDSFGDLCWACTLQVLPAACTSGLGCTLHVACEAGSRLLHVLACALCTMGAGAHACRGPACQAQRVPSTRPCHRLVSCFLAHDKQCPPLYMSINVQAVLHMLDITRQACLAGQSHRWAALAMLRHLRSDVFSVTAPQPEQNAPQQDTVPLEGEADNGRAPPMQNLFDRVQQRAGVLLEGVDTEETLQAVQLAIIQLEQWFNVLEVEDKMARLHRAVVSGAEDFLFEGNVSEALTAATVEVECATLHGDCAMPSQLSKMWLELKVLQADRHVMQGRSLWGGAAALLQPSAEGCAGVARHVAEMLRASVLQPLGDRLLDWHGCGATGCQVDVEHLVLPDEIEETHIQQEGGEQDRDIDSMAVQSSFAVRVTWCVDAVAIAAASEAAVESQCNTSGPGPSHPCTAVVQCMDAVVTSAADLIRYRALAAVGIPACVAVVAFMGQLPLPTCLPSGNACCLRLSVPASACDVLHDSVVSGHQCMAHVIMQLVIESQWHVCLVICRGDLLPDGRGVVVLTASSPFIAPRERAVPDSDALSSLHKEHVHGCRCGRFELLRALCGRLQRSSFMVAAARVRLWAAQSGVQVSEEVPVDEAALEMMGAAELQELLLAEELMLLHSSRKSNIAPSRLLAGTRVLHGMM